MKLIHYWGKILNPTSLQMRLTLGIAVVSILGLTGVVSWITWRMQQILIVTHKNNTQYIIGRFPHDVEIYSDMVTLEEGMQKAINNLTTTYTLLWVKTHQGKISAESASLKMSPQKNSLVSFKDIPSQPNLQLVNGRYWLLCSTKLKIKEVNLGQFYIAQDITNDQMMFLGLIRSLSFASFIAIIFMTVVTAWYIWRSLQPLARISHLTANISSEKLGEAQIELKNAPSEVKELAQTLEITLLRLADNCEHQRQLVSNVSHELRTPLTLVLGYLQSILRRGTNLTDMQRDALEIAASEANRTIHLLQDLLDLARADSGRMHFHLEPLILNELLDEVKAMVSQYDDRLIEFILPSNKMSIKVDSNRLKQVLLNLIDNAVKYSSEQSPILVKLSQIQEKAILEISDQGIGIPLADQCRIFERFYRIDEARSRTTGGTGLGLSIVKTLVEGMGGSIGVTSQLGKGSTFTVNFPLCR